MKKPVKIVLSVLGILLVVAAIAVSYFKTSRPAVEVTPTVAPTSVPTEEPAVEPTEVPAEPTEEPVCSHKDTTTFLAEETMEEYKYQEICSACGEVVKEYTVTKENPVPTATPTPLPTSTPTPLPTNTPTPTPKLDCKHEETATYLKEENKTESIYKVVCENCGEVVEEFTVPKATPTPTPRPTEKPVPTPTPTPKLAEVVKEFTTKSGHYVIEYADLTSLTIWKEGSAPTSVRKYETPISYITYYDADNHVISEEYLGRFDYETSENEVIECYVYCYYDGETDTWTSRLVNSDGSFNRLSDRTVNGIVGVSQTIYGYKESGWYLKSIDLRDSKIKESMIFTPDDFLYNKDGVIRLYEY